MEEKKLDINSIIGFLLIFGILIFWFYQNQPTPEELEAQKAQQEQQQVLEESTEPETATPLLETQAIDVADSTAVVSYKNAIGEFGFTQVSEGTTVLENEVLYLEISNKGGQVVEARMKNFVTYDSIPVYLVKDGNAIFDLNFTTTNNRVLNTRDLYFEPTLTNDGNNQVLSLKTKVSSTQFLEYRYEMKPTEYLVGFNVRSQGLNGIFNQNQPINLKWQLRGIRHNKSIQYENRYTRLTYNHEEGKISKLSETGDDEDTEIDVKWLSYRQHFFSSILTTNTHFETVDFTSKNLVTEESKEAQFTKEYTTVAPLQLEAGELSYAMNWYYGPTDIAVLKKYKELGLAESILL
jgi:YidC/Oxa1 family membrane protein insertase